MPANQIPAHVEEESPAYPAAFHYLLLQVFGGHHEHLDGLHQAGAGTKDPSEKKWLVTQTLRRKWATCFLIPKPGRPRVGGRGR